MFQEADKEVSAVLRENRDRLDALAEALLEHESRLSVTDRA